jgi:predicted NAD-dependent protein-ADP-ribosyltransferase YbiA (DUF1768 family)
MHKFVQHTELRDRLLATDDDILLAHVYELDRVYGTGMNEENFGEWMKKNDETVLKVCFVFLFDIFLFHI